MSPSSCYPRYWNSAYSVVASSEGITPRQADLATGTALLIHGRLSQTRADRILGTITPLKRRTSDDIRGSVCSNPTYRLRSTNATLTLIVIHLHFILNEDLFLSNFLKRGRLSTSQSSLWLQPQHTVSNSSLLASPSSLYSSLALEFYKVARAKEIADLRVPTFATVTFFLTVHHLGTNSDYSVLLSLLRLLLPKRPGYTADLKKRTLSSFFTLLRSFSSFSSLSTLLETWSLLHSLNPTLPFGRDEGEFSDPAPSTSLCSLFW